MFWQEKCNPPKHRNALWHLWCHQSLLKRKRSFTKLMEWKTQVLKIFNLSAAFLDCRATRPFSACLHRKPMEKLQWNTKMYPMWTAPKTQTEKFKQEIWVNLTKPDNNYFTSKSRQRKIKFHFTKRKWKSFRIIHFYVYCNILWQLSTFYLPILWKSVSVMKINK